MVEGVSMVPPAQGRPGLVLASVCAATLLVVGLVAAINLAAPQLAASDLRPSPSALLWIVDAYVVVFACLVIPGGALGDRYGRRSVLIGGLLLFAIGAVLSASAATLPILLLGRVLSGVGAAGVLPNCLGVLVHGTPAPRRAGAIAVWATATGLGGLVGNIGGGLLLTGGTWRVLLFTAAGLAVLCAGGVRVAAAAGERHRRALDPIGTVLLIAAVVTLLAAVIEAPDLGWSDPRVLAGLIGGALLGVLWTLFELRSTEPLLDPRLFRIPSFSAASAGMFVTFFGSFGLFYLNASLLQYSRGYTALQAGLAILPLSVPLLIGARFVPRLTARVGVTATLATAFAATGVGLLGLATAVQLPYAVYACWLVLLGAGLALALPTLTAELTVALPPERAGLAGGLQAAARELGSAIGVAVVGSILNAAFQSHLAVSLSAPPSGSRTLPEVLAGAPQDAAVAIAAFDAAVAVALTTAAVVTLLSGAIIIALTARPLTRTPGRSGTSSE